MAFEFPQLPLLGGGGAGSVASAQMAAEISNRISADNVLSQALSVLSLAVSVADAPVT